MKNTKFSLIEICIENRNVFLKSLCFVRLMFVMAGVLIIDTLKKTICQTVVKRLHVYRFNFNYGLYTFGYVQLLQCPKSRSCFANYNQLLISFYEILIHYTSE